MSRASRGYQSIVLFAGALLLAGCPGSSGGSGSAPGGQPGNLAAEFTGAPRVGTAPLAVVFSDLSGGSPTGWSWDFGDGATSSAQDPGHTYATPGTYTVSLTVTDASGADTETKVGYVTATSGGTDTTPPVITCPGDVSVPATGTDGFDGTSLDPSWSLLNPSFMTFSVSGGELHVQAIMGGPAFSWFADEEGPLIYRTITGDFTATATLRVEDPNNPGQTPPAPNRFGGLIARDPASVPGDRNSVHVVLGAGSSPSPVAEDKSTDGSNSVFSFTSIPQTRGDVRIARTGSLFSLEYRAPGSPGFQVLNSINRPDLPATLHVGPMIYSFSTPPDVIAHFDQVSITNALTVVNYPAPSAVDDTDPSPTVVCSPPSGSAFPLGTTTVLCTATDASGNSSTCSFTVTVNAVAPLVSSGVRRFPGGSYGIFLRLFPYAAPGQPPARGSALDVILR